MKPGETALPRQCVPQSKLRQEAGAARGGLAALALLAAGVAAQAQTAPVSVERLTLFASLGGQQAAHGRRRGADGAEPERPGYCRHLAAPERAARRHGLDLGAGQYQRPAHTRPAPDGAGRCRHGSGAEHLFQRNRPAANRPGHASRTNPRRSLGGGRAGLPHGRFARARRHGAAGQPKRIERQRP